VAERCEVHLGDNRETSQARAPRPRPKPRPKPRVDFSRSKRLDSPWGSRKWKTEAGRSAPQALRGVADRVLLGLLPSSEYAWPLAVACLKPRGGVMHVHENVAAADQTAWVARLEAALRAEAATLGRRWTVRCGHVERVKTFAPHVWHLVADVTCVEAERG